MKKNFDVLIVDDEILIANLLKKSIDWGQMEMQVNRIATSGFEALAMLEEKVADIIFTDIHMPIMDGLTFAKQVTTMYPQTKIIVLTGYDEFKYAKESVNIGVLAYIKKPINSKEIIEAALRAKDEINKQIKVVEDFNEMQLQLLENIDLLREKYLLSLAVGNISEDKLNSASKFYNIDFSKKILQFAVLEVLPKKSNDESIRLMLHHSALKLIKMQYQDTKDLYIFEDAQQRIAMLSLSTKIDLYDASNQIVIYLIEQLPCTTNVGIGSSYFDICEGRKSYEEACLSLKYATTTGENEIADATDLIINKNILKTYNVEDVEELNFYINLGMMDNAQHSLDKIYKTLLKNNTSIKTSKIIFTGISSGISQALILYAESGLEAVEYQSNIVNEIYAKNDMQSIYRVVNKYVIKVATEIADIHKQTQNTSIVKIKKYIDDNISDSNLSLKKMADVFNYNKSYLSRLFRQETGKTFSDYLLHVRMTKAMTLLTSTNMRSYQISNEIGYMDPNYFSICFKKHTSMTVSEYRLNSHHIKE